MEWTLKSLAYTCRASRLVRLLLGPALLALAVPVQAQTAGQAEGPSSARAPQVLPAPAPVEATPLAPGPQPVQLPPELTWPGDLDADFILTRRRHLARIAAHPAGTPGHGGAVRDLALFHAARGMGTEALSMLAALDDAELAPPAQQEIAALELLLGLADSLARPLSPRAEALLQPRYAAWPETPLVQALMHLRRGEVTAAGPLLPAALPRLDRLPPRLQEGLLPRILAAAVDTRQWRLARDLALAFDHHATLRDGGAYHYALGRAAEAGGDDLAAFDSYLQAQAEASVWGHRARRAIIALGLRSRSLSAEDAVTLLRQESEVWRGDAEEAATLSELARLQEITGDRVAAVLSWGRLIQARPGSPEAEAAQAQARSLIREIYDRGHSGEMGLTAFLEAHQTIARYFRFDPVYIASAELYADRFAALGGTASAAQEYGLVRDYMLVASDLGRGQASAEVLDRLLMKQAHAFAEVRQYDRLAEVLAEPLRAPTPAQQQDRALLAEEYRRATGQAVNLDALFGQPPSPRLLRIRARALFDQGDWAEAESTYAALWDRQGQQMAFADAVNFLLAAYRNEDFNRVQRLVEAFPRLTQLPAWAIMAETLGEDVPPVLPLRAETARARLEAAQETLDHIPGISD